MSYAEVSKTHVDAMVTAAVRWTASGVANQLEDSMRQELDLSSREADEVSLAPLLR